MPSLWEKGAQAIKGGFAKVKDVTGEIIDLTVDAAKDAAEKPEVKKLAAKLGKQAAKAKTAAGKLTHQAQATLETGLANLRHSDESKSLLEQGPTWDYKPTDPELLKELIQAHKTTSDELEAPMQPTINDLDNLWRTRLKLQYYTAWLALENAKKGHSKGKYSASPAIAVHYANTLARLRAFRVTIAREEVSKHYKDSNAFIDKQLEVYKKLTFKTIFPLRADPFKKQLNVHSDKFGVILNKIRALKESPASYPNTYAEMSKIIGTFWEGVRDTAAKTCKVTLKDTDEIRLTVTCLTDSLTHHRLDKADHATVAFMLEHGAFEARTAEAEAEIKARLAANITLDAVRTKRHLCEDKIKSLKGEIDRDIAEKDAQEGATATASHQTDLTLCASTTAGDAVAKELEALHHALLNEQTLEEHRMHRTLLKALKTHFEAQQKTGIINPAHHILHLYAMYRIKAKEARDHLSETPNHNDEELQKHIATLTGEAQHAAVNIWFEKKAFCLKDETPAQYSMGSSAIQKHYEDATQCDANSEARLVRVYTANQRAVAMWHCIAADVKKNCTPEQCKSADASLRDGQHHMSAPSAQDLMALLGKLQNNTAILFGWTKKKIDRYLHDLLRVLPSDTQPPDYIDLLNTIAAKNCLPHSLSYCLHAINAKDSAAALNCYRQHRKQLEPFLGQDRRAAFVPAYIEETLQPLAAMSAQVDEIETLTDQTIDHAVYQDVGAYTTTLLKKALGHAEKARGTLVDGEGCAAELDQNIADIIKAQPEPDEGEACTLLALEKLKTALELNIKATALINETISHWKQRASDAANSTTTTAASDQSNDDNLATLAANVITLSAKTKEANGLETAQSAAEETLIAEQIYCRTVITHHSACIPGLLDTAMQYNQALKDANIITAYDFELELLKCNQARVETAAQSLQSEPTQEAAQASMALVASANTLESNASKAITLAIAKNVATIQTNIDTALEHKEKTATSFFLKNHIEPENKDFNQDLVNAQRLVEKSLQTDLPTSTRIDLLQRTKQVAESASKIDQYYTQRYANAARKDTLYYKRIILELSAMDYCRSDTATNEVNWPESAWQAVSDACKILRQKITTETAQTNEILAALANNLQETSPILSGTNGLKTTLQGQLEHLSQIANNIPQMQTHTLPTIQNVHTIAQCKENLEKILSLQTQQEQRYVHFLNAIRSITLAAAGANTSNPLEESAVNPQGISDYTKATITTLNEHPNAITQRRTAYLQAPHELPQRPLAEEATVTITESTDDATPQTEPTELTEGGGEGIQSTEESANIAAIIEDEGQALPQIKSREELDESQEKLIQALQRDQNTNFESEGTVFNDMLTLLEPNANNTPDQVQIAIEQFNTHKKRTKTKEIAVQAAQRMYQPTLFAYESKHQQGVQEAHSVFSEAFKNAENIEALCKAVDDLLSNKALQEVGNDWGAYACHVIYLICNFFVALFGSALEPSRVQCYQDMVNTARDELNLTPIATPT